MKRRGMGSFSFFLHPKQISYKTKLLRYSPHSECKLHVFVYYRKNKRIFPVDYFIQIFCKLPNTYTSVNYEKEINFPSLYSGDTNYLRARYIFPPLKCAEWSWVNRWMQLSRGNQQLMELLSSHRSVARPPGAPPVIMKVLDLFTV